MQDQSTYFLQQYQLEVERKRRQRRFVLVFLPLSFVLSFVGFAYSPVSLTVIFL